MSTKIEKLILLDTDVISHFISGGQFTLLPKIFKNKKVILDIVTNELRVKKKFKIYIENVINSGFIKEINFNNNKQVVIEFSNLKRMFGEGESACMAYCRFNKDVLASSNLKDITKYCEDNNIEFLTTMDFLAEALNSGQLTEQECNEFIKNVKAVGSILPVNSITDYIKNFKVRSI
jgi:hypothetical protein